MTAQMTKRPLKTAAEVEAALKTMTPKAAEAGKPILEYFRLHEEFNDSDPDTWDEAHAKRWVTDIRRIAWTMIERADGMTQAIREGRLTLSDQQKEAVQVMTDPFRKLIEITQEFSDLELIHLSPEQIDTLKLLLNKAGRNL